MVSITIGEETVEAENLQQANRLAKKLQRKQQKIDAEKSLKHDRARERAYAKMGLICSIAWDKSNNRSSTLPRGYKAYPASDKYYCQVIHDGRQFTYHANTEDGDAAHKGIGYTVTHEIRNGAGFSIAFRCASSPTSESDIQWNTVGIFEDVHCIVYCPDVLHDVFESML